MSKYNYARTNILHISIFTDFPLLFRSTTHTPWQTLGWWWILIIRETYNQRKNGKMFLLSGEYLTPRYCNTDVNHYRHYLKFHLIDRKWKSRDDVTTTGALMIAERNRDGIHQFAHGFANTRSTGNPVFISTTRLSPFFVLLREQQTTSITVQFSRRDNEAFFNDGGIDAFNCERGRKNRSWARALSRKSIRGIFFSRSLEGFAYRFLFSPCCCGVTSTKKREISTRRFHNGEPIVSRVPSRMCVGCGGFQDQDIAHPLLPSSFDGSFVYSSCFYCQVAWIMSTFS